MLKLTTKTNQSSALLGLCEVNSSVTGGLTYKKQPIITMTSSWVNAESVLMSWRRHLVHFIKRRAMSSGGGPCHQAVGQGVHNNGIHNVIEGPSRKLFPWQPMPHNWLAPLCSGKAPHTLEYQLSWFANLAYIIAESFRWLSTRNT